VASAPAAAVTPPATMDSVPKNTARPPLAIVRAADAEGPAAGVPLRIGGLPRGAIWWMAMAMGSLGPAP